MSLIVGRRTFYGLVGTIALFAALGFGYFLARGGATAPSQTINAPGAADTVAQAPVAVAPVDGAVDPAAADPAAAGPQADPTYSALPRIELADAFAQYEDGSALFVDARVASQYADGHIAGAMSMPETEAGTRFGELPTDKDIIVYCA